MSPQRKTVIAGNWKMNKTPNEARSLIKELLPMLKGASCQIAVCVPFVDLHAVLEETKNTNLKVGAQNCHYEPDGAFTGEVSAKMLAEMHVDYAIIGHSERRLYFGETDETVNKRTKACLSAGISPIVCVGESLKQKNSGITQEILRLQIKLALEGLKKQDIKNIIIAYEPIWAIGTGLAATSDQAGQACACIRSAVQELYDQDMAANLVIQYGGSMNVKNAAELLAQPDIDGGLIGGASLKAHDFAAIVNSLRG